MVRHFQRRIIGQTEALPSVFADRAAWEGCRGQLAAWLRKACAVSELKHGPAIPQSREEKQGRIVERLLLPQDDGLFCPLVLYRPADDNRKPRPAIILSHFSAGCADDQSVQAIAAELVDEGLLVAVPEHASAHPQSPRRVKSISSLYGIGDSTGLPPLAMRVWDDLSCVEYLSKRKDVDRRSIRMAGLGVGGIDVAMAAAIDDRIAGVAAVGTITVRDWAERVAPRLDRFDRIMPYLPGIAAKTDLQYIYAAVAPRPLLLVDATDRVNWPKSAHQRVRKQAEQVYGLYAAADKLTTTPSRSHWGIEELRRWAKRETGDKSNKVTSAD